MKGTWPKPKPELLAPAGDWECVRAAVENGADAIYFGLDRFNARMRADNFRENDLPELIKYLHARGVKGYVTFNTLVFTDELPEAEEYLRAIIAAGVDAAIVQDVGVCRLIRSLSPDFPIHASTQMTITSAAGVEFARQLGCNLVVLARECSIQEIAAMQNPVMVAEGREPGADQREEGVLPLEVFVHGALCVAYSGQCLTSESLGGRSANRGECAQACRMPYQLVSDGAVVPLDERKYLLSPQDLAGLEAVPDLIRAGVSSFKIEGRLKSPEYVANITQVYRNAIDRIYPAVGAEAGGDGTGPRPADHLAASLTAESRYDVEMAFSRGLSTGWLRGINNQELVHGRFGKKRGVLLGTVLGVRNQRIGVRLVAPLKIGDGVVFDAAHPEEAESGGRVQSLQQEGDIGWLQFDPGCVDLGRIESGQKIWKTDDPALNRRLRRSFRAEQPQFRRPLTVEIRGTTGQFLELTARDDAGHWLELKSEVPLMTAENQPLTLSRLHEQFGRLGGTPFRLAALTADLPGPVILPVSELNRLRREMVDQFQGVRAQPARWHLRPPTELGEASEATFPELAPSRSSLSGEVELAVLVRNLDQLWAATQAGVRRVYCEFEDVKKYRDAVAQFRALKSADQAPGRSEADSNQGSGRGEIFVVPPRIFKTGEDWILRQVRSSAADGYLIRNYDQLAFFGEDRRIGDFSLNISNPLSARYFIERYQLEWVTVSYDLNGDQVAGLLAAAPAHWFEITVHQHMPMFHMEHCVFCAFLSTGTDYTNCGRPCDRHDVKLRDRVGRDHPLRADAGCRNTVFNAVAQTGAEHVYRFRKLGAQRFRLEFVDETAEVVKRTIGEYQRLFRGEIKGSDLWRELRLFNQLGVARGMDRRAAELKVPANRTSERPRRPGQPKA